MRFQMLCGPQGVKVAENSVDPPIIKSIAEGRPPPSESQLAIDNPFVNLLIRVVRGVLAAVQGGSTQFVGIPYAAHAVTTGASLPEDRATTGYKTRAGRLQKWWCRACSWRLTCRRGWWRRL
ncbi:MAG: hypothetical protein V3T55_02630 [Anaerolineales bacterium]